MPLTKIGKKVEEKFEKEYGEKKGKGYFYAKENKDKKFGKATRNKGYKNYKLAIDHDHKTGKIRGVLCFPCNKALGFMEDDIERLKNAIKYLGLSKLSPTQVKTARINNKASESEPYIRP